ncbi:MAG TPA: putative quinol monooxygenase [Steroidobacteraceae bacterium]|nr:putative quinol monooxygenase [Steroidobacteraceae bacterium]
MLIIVGTIRLPPGNLAAARAAMERMITASRAEGGCLAYAYSEDILEPGLIHVTERWLDPASLKRHWNSEHLVQWRATWETLGLHDRNLQLYSAEPITI